MTDLYRAGPLLSALREAAPMLDVPDRAQLCAQLAVTLRDYYVHLPIKQAAFSIDPVHQLEVLQQGVGIEGDELPFMQSLLRIVNGLRDRHTTLGLPAPWSGLVAYLPILVECYWQAQEPVYLLSRVMFGYENPDLVPGSRITHWNGMPIDLYLRHVLAPQTQGANPAAMHTLALANLSIRPLAYVLLPEEDWVTLDLVGEDGTPRQVRLDWKYFVEQPGSSGSSLDGGVAARPDIGLDERLQRVNRHRSRLFRMPRPPMLPTQAPPLLRWTGQGETGRWGIADTPSGEVGYLRLYSFEVQDVAAFLASMVAALQSLPCDRLIVDIRNNPGGVIPAGEGLVQLLCPRPITVAPVTFRNTLATRGFGRLPDFRAWRASLDLMSVSGERFAQLFPLSDPTLAPAYRYPGRCALIVDAASYSTCDFVAADFRDNRVGLLVGTEDRSGGGGANVWPFELLASYAAQAGSQALGSLPRGMSLNVAMRRAVRTGSAAGLPIENFGVPVERVLRLSRRDLFEDNIDLISRTAALL